MTAQSPRPFPFDGQRKLTARENFERIQAQQCLLVSARSAAACKGQIYVGVFFDGTGNNMDIDYYGGDGTNTLGEGREPLSLEKRKHTNIVKIYQAFPRQQHRGYFRIYIPGVGTPFPEIGDDSRFLFDKNRGAIGAERGENRILWALLQLLNAPHQYVRGKAHLLIPDGLAKTICDNLASVTGVPHQRRLALQTWQDKLQQALRSNLPRVVQINLCVFGFSRGAAQARAFVNWLLEACEPHDGGWRFAGMALNLQFLGLFDTVASVGLANLFDGGTLAGHQSWADNNLQIHPAVRQCLHMVAGHELRACFPLDSVRVKGGYPANVKEVVYPGAHSDVGGGYAPGALGVAPGKPNDMVSIFPGSDMYDAARIAGVPLPPFNNLKDENQDLYVSLTPSNGLTHTYNAYLQDSAVSPAPVEEMLRRHMSLYQSFRFKHRRRFNDLVYVSNAQGADSDFVHRTQQGFMQRLARLGGGDRATVPQTAGLGQLDVAAHVSLRADKQGDPMRNARYDGAAAARAWREQARLMGGQPLTHAEQQWCAVAERLRPQDVTPSMDALFAHFLHDSLAGFMAMGMDEGALNSMGLAKFRTVFKGND